MARALGLSAAVVFLSPANTRAQTGAETRFGEVAQPILEEYCLGCHGAGIKKGNVDLSPLDEAPLDPEHRALWLRVLKNVRAGLMPPREEPRPSGDQRAELDAWIKKDAFELDANQPDPGPSFLRRLNRAEYARTVRDLMGVEYRTEEEFPPDDTGYGFDTIAEVLAVSPLLLEKYIEAAKVIVEQAVPSVPRVVARRWVNRRDWRRPDEGRAEPRTSFYGDLTVEARWDVETADEYRIVFDLAVRSGFEFDPARCEVTLAVDDRELTRQELTWSSYNLKTHEFVVKLEPGSHIARFSVKSLADPSKKKHEVEALLEGVRIEGPLSPERWVRPDGYERFFFEGDAPETDAGRLAYAREILEHYAKRAFRRPVDAAVLDRLVEIARQRWSQPGETFESGVGRALVAVLASPRFLFRIEETLPLQPGERYPLVDEWTLATRLSYFLWSTMPDETLLDLAARGALRADLDNQVRRMIADERGNAFVENFVGQWLQTRDIEGVSINGGAVLRRDRARGERGGGPFDFDRDLRLAMKRETEMLFAHVLKEDRSVIDLIDNNYTFLNERLAKHYGIEGVRGDQMRKVDLPPENPRGGILTHGSFLAVTSNPTRTSPVKRGLFVLDNILGTPAPPPPAEVPELEEAEKAIEGHQPTLREALELHRKQPLCNACHARFDPIGLALENFNAMGMWRDKEREQPIDGSGMLLTGESFRDQRELRTVLARDRALDFERCLVEKVLTYALGRGLDYYDLDTIDAIVARLEGQDRRMSALMHGVIESAPFQRRRPRVGVENAPAGQPASAQPSE